MQYVLGIDGGGTHFRVQAASLDGTVLSEYTGSPISHYYLSPAEVLPLLEHHLSACLQTFGGQRSQCRAIVGGTTGLDSPEDAQILQDYYAALQDFSCPIHLMNDAELAHHTVTGGVGILVISGTGSIAFGRNHANETARMGGWLFSIFGEEGSGSWLTRRCLRQLAAFLDGAVTAGPLVNMLQDTLGIFTPKQLSTLATQIATPPWQEPKLGAIIDCAILEGDSFAITLVQEAAKETWNLAQGLARRLGMEHDADLRIGLWGSNILKSSLHLETVHALARAELPNATLLLPKQSALEGAVQLALTRVRG